MRVGLNATCFDDRPSGANQRFLVLYGELIRRHPEIEFVVYEPIEHRIADWFGNAANVTARKTSIPASGRIVRLLTGMRYWQRALREDRIDLFECFNLPLVEARRCPTLITVHDIRSIESGSAFTTAIARAIHNHAFAHADHVITVSESMRRQIESFRPGTPVTTVYNAVRPSTGPPQVAAPAGLPDVFMLTLGHLEPRKNFATLIDAVAALRAQGRSRPLVIVGNDGGAKADLYAQIEQLQLGSLVHIVEQASDAVVASLYASARLFVMPSRYEGFGIPLIEAMATGVPLVSSDISVFREIRGEACGYFPADDVMAAAAAIELLWSDDVARARSIAAGFERAPDFAPNRLADRIADLYRRVLGVKPAG